MRRFLDGPAVVAAFMIAAGSPLAADCAWATAHKTPAAAPVAVPSVACLGGVLNDKDVSSYLTVADYPAFAAISAGPRRIFICGDSIPSFLPSATRVGFASRHH